MNGVLIESDPSPIKLEVLGVEDWYLVKEQVGQRSHLESRTETSYIVEGSGTITDEDGHQHPFMEGDLVTIMPNTECRWHITEAIERHYSNG